jgi:hypothetical protein
MTKQWRARLRRFVHRPLAEQGLLVAASLLLIGISLSLRLLSFQRLYRYLSGMSRLLARSGAAGALPPDWVAWAVKTSGDVLLGRDTCLIRALTAQTLLELGRQPSLLYLGVSRDDDGQFRSHAWVEHNGRILVGEVANCSYTPIARFEPASTTTVKVNP